jgi:hypothetical protein
MVGEDDLQPVSPQHQNVSPFRAEETTKSQQLAIGLIGRMIARSHIGVEQLNPHAVVIARMRFYESAQISGNALIRIETKHPVEQQLFARRLLQKSAMSPLGNPACLDVRFPRPVCHNQSDFRVSGKNFERSIRTRIIIGNYRIDVLTDVVQCVSENKRFITNAGDSDQKVPMAQQACIASNDLFALAELPAARARHIHHLAVIEHWHHNGGRAQ